MGLRLSARVGLVAMAMLVAGFAGRPAGATVTDGRAVGQPQPTDVVAEARRLATAGQRPAAVKLLQDRLAVRPDDSDARTLLGIVLSWDGRYDDARVELNKVLAGNPTHGDALPALVNVEYWSDHPTAVLALVEIGLHEKPHDTTLLLAQARALNALARQREALLVLERLLAVDSRHEQANRVRESILDAQRNWAIGYNYSYDWFNNGRTAWQEQQVSLKRGAGWGSAVLRASQADRFGLRDRQFEIDVYPRLRPGTYLYVNAGWAPDKTLYPEYRYGLHWYQSLGRGFEGSVGYSRLGFGNGVNMYIGSLSKYVGNWLFISQAFITPSENRTSTSFHLAYRRYFGDTNYFGMRYQHGWANQKVNTVEDYAVLNARAVTGEFVSRLGRRWELTLRGGFSRQQRIYFGTQDHYSSSATLYFRF